MITHLIPGIATIQRTLLGGPLDGWTMVRTFALENERIVIMRLTIEPTTPGEIPAGGITARMLRQLRVQLPIENTFRRMAPRRTRRRPTKRADERFYLELARDYVETWHQGAAKNPTAALAARRQVPLKTMRSWIHAARNRHGLLTETTRGRPGGQLTEKAVSLLAALAAKADS